MGAMREATAVVLKTGPVASLLRWVAQAAALWFDARLKLPLNVIGEIMTVGAIAAAIAGQD